MAFSLTVAETSFILQFSDPNLEQQASEYFAGWISDRAPEGTIEFTALGRSVEWPPDEHLTPPVARLEGRRYTAQWICYEGFYDLERGSGVCKVADIFGIRQFLCALASVLLPERDGLLIHASSATDGRQAFLFPAPSGTGKSTLLRNSPNHTVLCDEGTIVRLTDRGVMAYGSPFRSDNYRDLHDNCRPVAGLYFLKQAQADRLTVMTPAESLQRLLRETFLYCNDPNTRRMVFLMAERLVGCTPFYRLELRNGPDFWACVYHGLQDQTETGVSGARA